jgi:hypothetical protein
MKGKADLKVSGGKLLRAEVEIEAGTVLAASVDGDFFAHPEEEFEAAESELSGLPADSLGDAALALFSRPGLTIYGASPIDIAKALKEAARAAQAR